MLKKLSREPAYLLKVLKARHIPVPFLFAYVLHPHISTDLKFGTHFYGDAGDGLQNIWNFWWVN